MRGSNQPFGQTHLDARARGATGPGPLHCECEVRDCSDTYLLVFFGALSRLRLRARRAPAMLFLKTGGVTNQASAADIETRDRFLPFAMVRTQRVSRHTCNHSTSPPVLKAQSIPWSTVK
jgi:hypothetical protein